MKSPKPTITPSEIERIDLQRQLLADYCRQLGNRLTLQKSAAPLPPCLAENPTTPTKSEPALSPRLRQTLNLLLDGRGEKEVALTLRISKHTVHAYVKELHRRFGVTSRAELLARWVRNDRTFD